MVSFSQAARRHGPRLSREERIAAKRARTRPGWVSKHILGVDLAEYQQDALTSAMTNRDTAVASGHAIGKSLTAACTIIEAIVTRPGSKVIVTAPTHRQVASIIFPEIRALAAAARIPLAKAAPLETKWNVDPEGNPNWFVLGFATKENDPTKFQGQHAKSGEILIVVEEACGVSRQIMDEGVSALMTSDGARVFKIGNPTDASSAFYDDFKNPLVTKFKIPSTRTENFTKFGITLEDITSGEMTNGEPSWKLKVTGPYPRPYLATPDWVYYHWIKCDRDVNHPDFRARVLAEFPESSTDMLVSIALADAAAARFLAAAPVIVEAENLVYLVAAGLRPTTPLILGVDVARRGTDSTVVVARQGRRAWVVGRWKGLDGNQVAGQVRDLVRTMGATAAHIDVIGVGASVVDALSGEQWCVPCNSSNRAEEEERFINSRAEAYWRVRTAYVNGEIDCGDVDIREQLAKTKYIYTRAGKFQIESKDEIKKRLGFSPDEADALSLTFYRSGSWLWS